MLLMMNIYQLMEHLSHQKLKRKLPFKNAKLI